MITSFPGQASSWSSHHIKQVHIFSRSSSEFHMHPLTSLLHASIHTVAETLLLTVASELFSHFKWGYCLRAH